MMAAVARLRGAARVCWFPGHGHESDRAGGRRPRARLLRASPLFSSAVMIRRRRRIIEPAQREQCAFDPSDLARSEEHTSELQSLMRIPYAVFCLKKKNKK